MTIFELVSEKLMVNRLYRSGDGSEGRDSANEGGHAGSSPQPVCAGARDSQGRGRYGLLVVKDNTQAIDVCGGDFKIGEPSDAICISFFIQNNLGRFGDGGAVWPNHPYITDRICKLRNHGSGRGDVYNVSTGAGYPRL